MPKQIKEFLFDQTTGEINTEYDDNSTEKFNLAAVNQAVSSQAAAIAAVDERVAALQAGGGTVVNAPTTATFTATLTNNSAVLSGVSSFTDIAVGRIITGTGVESGAAVQSFDAGAGTVTLTKVCKGTTAIGRTFVVEVEGKDGLLSTTPAEHYGLIATSDGWGNPQGYSPLYNYRPSQVRKFLVARGAAIAGKFGGYNTNSIGTAGVYQSNILVYGDSKAVGNTPVSPNVPKRMHSPYNQVANILNASGNFECVNNALVFGYAQAGSSEMTQFDNRVTFEDSAWSFDGSDPSFIMGMVNNTTTGYMRFTPAEQCDSYDIYIRAHTSADSSFSWAVDGGGATTVPLGAGNDFKLLKFTVSAGALGSHSLTIRRVAGTIRVAAVIPKNSAYYGINVINFSIAGAGVKQRAGFSGSATNGIAAHNTYFSPRLVIEHWGYTDIGDAANQSTAIAETITAYTTEIDRWQALGVPVVIVSPSPWDDVNLYRDDASQRDFLRALRSLCVSKNLPMIDLDNRWGSWQEASAAGFLTHYARPDPAGNADMGYVIARAIAAM